MGPGKELRAALLMIGSDLTCLVNIEAWKGRLGHVSPWSSHWRNDSFCIRKVENYQTVLAWDRVIEILSCCIIIYTLCFVHINKRIDTIVRRTRKNLQLWSLGHTRFADIVGEITSLYLTSCSSIPKEVIPVLTTIANVAVFPSWIRHHFEVV
jgi:hypothetical protein